MGFWPCFNPRTPCGVRQYVLVYHFQTFAGFNPRTPCGVRPHHGQSRDAFLGFQSTHSLRSATQLILLDVKSLNVSIHALLAECDLNEAVIKYFVDGFNPRTPCGVRLQVPSRWWTLYKFQSTHSLRSATSPLKESNKKSRVSIHALLAECDIRLWLISRFLYSFNPRTPCGVRHVLPALADIDMVFQSTHSLRSATAWLQWDNAQAPVSIHALLAECDRPIKSKTKNNNSFNPRTPCGVRRAQSP